MTSIERRQAASAGISEWPFLFPRAYYHDVSSSDLLINKRIFTLFGLDEQRINDPPVALAESTGDSGKIVRKRPRNGDLLLSIKPQPPP